MSDMRERLARALYTDLAKRTDEGGAHYCMLSELDASNGCRVEGRISLPHLVDAILAELREPTPEMVDKAYDAEVEHRTYSESGCVTLQSISAAFTAAIDAIKGGGK